MNASSSIPSPQATQTAGNWRPVIALALAAFRRLDQHSVIRHSCSTMRSIANQTTAAQAPVIDDCRITPSANPTYKPGFHVALRLAVMFPWPDYLPSCHKLRENPLRLQND
jgi:hypothetical protein